MSRYSEEQLLLRTASYPCGTNMNCHTSRSHVTLLWENTFCSTLYRVPVVKTWVISQLSQSYHTSQREQLLLHSVLGKGEGEKGQGVEANQFFEKLQINFLKNCKSIFWKIANQFFEKLQFNFLKNCKSIFWKIANQFFEKLQINFLICFYSLPFLVKKLIFLKNWFNFWTHGVLTESCIYHWVTQLKSR